MTDIETLKKEIIECLRPVDPGKGNPPDMKNELAAAWIASALADLKSKEHFKDDAFLTHIMAFHAQQCVEKCFKAFLERSTGEVLRIHSTLKLFAMVKDELKCEFDTDLLTDLDALYIDARYPADVGIKKNVAGHLRCKEVA